MLVFLCLHQDVWEAPNILSVYSVILSARSTQVRQSLQVITLPPPLWNLLLGALWELPLIHKSWIRFVHWSCTCPHSKSHICAWCSDLNCILIIFFNECWTKNDGMFRNECKDPVSYGSYQVTIIPRDSPVLEMFLQSKLNICEFLCILSQL